MKCEVTVYRFRDPHAYDDAGQQLPGCEPAPFGVLSIQLDRVAAVEVEGAGLSNAEIAARAWIEAIGRDRQAFLIEELKAPAGIVEAECNQRAIAAVVREAPAGFPGLYRFIFDNLIESWFIEFDSQWEPDRTPAALPVRRHQWLDPAKHEPATGLAALRSLWEPRLN